MNNLTLTLDKRTKRVMQYALLFVLLAYGYRFFMTGYSHDSLDFATNLDYWKRSLGRVIQPLYWGIRGRVAAPLLVGALYALWTALSCVLVVRLLDIRTEIGAFLVAGVLVTDHSMIATSATYVNELDSVAFALLLSVMAVYVLMRMKRAGWLIAPVLLGLSIGTYQAYMQVYVILCMICVVQKILEDREKKNVLPHLLEGVKCVAVLLAGLLVYWVLMNSEMARYGVRAAEGYNSITNVGDYAGLNLVELLKNTYLYPFEYWRTRVEWNGEIMWRIRIAVMVLAILETMYVALKKAQKIDLGGVLICLVLTMTPLGMNCVYFVSKGTIHELMVHAYCFIDVYAIFITERALSTAMEDNKWQARVKTALSGVFAAMVSFTLLGNVVFANQLYLKKDLEWDATIGYMTRMLDRVEQLDGYVPKETPVAFVGNMMYSPLQAPRENLDGFWRVTGAGTQFSPTYVGTEKKYLQQVFGYPFKAANNLDEIKALEQVQNMPPFPQNGSVQMIDGTAVVKLSDVME